MLVLLFFFPDLSELSLLRNGCNVTLSCTTDRQKRIWWRVGNGDEFQADIYAEDESFVMSKITVSVNEITNITCIGVDAYRNIQEPEMLVVNPPEGLWCSLLLYTCRSASPNVRTV